MTLSSNASAERRSFADALPAFRFEHYSPAVARIVSDALHEQDIDPYDLIITATDLLLLDDRIASSSLEALTQPLALSILSECLVIDRRLESRFVEVRRRLLQDPSASPALVQALGRQCRNNDSVWDIDDQERDLVHNLPPHDERRAMYEPGPEAIDDVVLDTLGSPPSDEVRDFYERYPFPKWWRVRSRTPRPLGDLVREDCPDAGPDLPGRGAEVLVVGCGTGRDTVTDARLYEDSRILGVDFSAASLRRAITRARQHGAANVRFLHADLNSLAAAGMMFDAVEAFGMLHHLVDPGEGLRALCGLLRPGGVLALGVYSRRGRESVDVVRQAAKNEGIGDDVLSLRRFRPRVPLLGDAGEEIARRFDFYSVTHLRDLILHPRECAYTIPELRDLLRGQPLEILGFSHLPEGLRGRHRDLEAIDSWERDHPMTFGDMYRLWLRRT